MIYLYHGTDTEITVPLRDKGRKGTDFRWRKKNIYPSKKQRGLFILNSAVGC